MIGSRVFSVICVDDFIYELVLLHDTSGYTAILYAR